MEPAQQHQHRKPRYDPNATCSKCGGTSVDVRYCNRNHDAGEYAKTQTFMRRPAPASLAGDEHWDRRCTFCGYTWTEPMGAA